MRVFLLVLLLLTALAPAAWGSKYIHSAKVDGALTVGGHRIQSVTGESGIAVSYDETFAVVELDTAICPEFGDPDGCEIYLGTASGGGSDTVFIADTSQSGGAVVHIGTQTTGNSTINIGSSTNSDSSITLNAGTAGGISFNADVTLQKSLVFASSSGLTTTLKTDSTATEDCVFTLPDAAPTSIPSGYSASLGSNPQGILRWNIPTYSNYINKWNGSME